MLLSFSVIPYLTIIIATLPLLLLHVSYYNIPRNYVFYDGKALKKKAFDNSLEGYTHSLKEK